MNILVDVRLFGWTVMLEQHFVNASPLVGIYKTDHSGFSLDLWKLQLIVERSNE